MSTVSSAIAAIGDSTDGTGLFSHLDPDTLRAVEAGAEWVELRAGETLFRQGDSGDSLCVLITGRLEVLIEAPGRDPIVVGEVSRGESVGEMAVLTGEPRSATIRAVRDSSLVRLSKDAFERVTLSSPQAMLAITRRIIIRLQQRNRAGTPKARLSNIAIVSLDEGNLAEIADKIVRALQTLGSTGALTSAIVHQACRDLDDRGVAHWLDDHERQHAFSAYIADPGPTAWTATAVRQADRILLVADASRPPDTARVDAAFARMGLDARRSHVELLLVHPAGTSTPSGTSAWLDATRVRTHHQVRRDTQGDFERVARMLTGRAVGLVLGGGGARGFAHIGVIRAMQEAGIPIDAVGGTSMGAIIAAQCGLGLDAAQMLELNHKCWIEANPLKDKTLPVVALLSCHRLDAMVATMFGNVEIEDLWRRYFCVSANLTHARVRVHDRGRLGRAARASMSLPGIAIPIYDDGALLVDGGVLNNLPADVMKKRAGGKVIAVNVTPEKDLAVPAPYAEAMSGWRMLLGQGAVKLPGILAIMSRTTLLANAQQREAVVGDIDLLVNPRIDEWGMFDWHKLKDIANAGYVAACKALEQWPKA